jgi:hypothetical protein
MTDTLAPAEQVMQSRWFVAERDDGKPTRWQRVIFAIQGGLLDAFVKGTLGVHVVPLRDTLLGAVNDLSKHVHGNENTVVPDVAKQNEVARSTIEALEYLLDVYQNCRFAIVGSIRQQLDDAPVEALLAETIMEVDELATHHSLDEVYVDETWVKAIGANSIIYGTHGSISVTLQWGSNSDVKRGDGVEIEQPFRFQCDIEVPLDSPWDLSCGDRVHH